MLEFLQIVLYIPNPIIIAAKVAKGTKMKKLVFFPIVASIEIEYKIVSLFFNFDSENSFCQRIL